MERNYEQEVKDIEIHMDMLCGDNMREHAVIDRKHHTLPFQIFRLLGGYNEALEKLKAQEFFTKAQFVVMLNDGEYCAQARSPDGIKSGASAFGATAQEALSNVIRKIANMEGK